MQIDHPINYYITYYYMFNGSIYSIVSLVIILYVIIFTSFILYMNKKNFYYILRVQDFFSVHLVIKCRKINIAATVVKGKTGQY